MKFLSRRKSQKAMEARTSSRNEKGNNSLGRSIAEEKQQRKDIVKCTIYYA